jgi:hypothetical protein
MDGRPLVEILDGEFASREVSIGAASDGATLINGNGEYSVDDEATISERLRALGYIS